MTLAARIVPTVYDLWDGIGFDYVQSVEAEYVAHGSTLLAYFRAMETLAAEPITAASIARYDEMFDQDAQFILRGGLVHLLGTELTDDERRLATAMLKIEDEALA